MRENIYLIRGLYISPQNICRTHTTQQKRKTNQLKMGRGPEKTVFPKTWGWPTSVITRDMQVKTMIKYHLTPAGMVTIKNTRNKCWRGCGETEAPTHCWWDCRLAQPLWKTVWRFLKR